MNFTVEKDPGTILYVLSQILDTCINGITRVIGDALKNIYPEEPRGRMAHHLNTLVALVCGIEGVSPFPESLAARNAARYHEG